MQRRGRWSVFGVFTSLACLLGAMSCGGALEPDADGVDRIVLTPTSASVEAGATVTLNALVLDAAGNAMRERKVNWASENSSIATVSQSGVVTGVSSGVVDVAASSGGKSASATITVTARPVSLVRVTPGSATIAVTGSITLQAEALDASGAPVLGRPIAWASSNETVAVVSATGVVAGIATGSVTISATIDNRTGTASITVAPQPVASVTITPEADTVVVGRRVTFRAIPVDANNLPLIGRTVEWTSSDPTIAAVSSAGEVLGLAPGVARIRATVEGKSAEATILVDPVPVARVVAAPNQITLNPGQTSQLIVTLSDSAGNVLSGRSISYTTSDANVVTVSTSGLVTAVAEGTAQIQVSSEGKTASVSITVNAVPVASIRITPQAVSLRISQTTKLTAQAFDAHGNALPNRKFTWISGAPSVATVTQQGDVTAIGIGTAAVFAATEGFSASATITVNAVPVASVQVTPTTLSLVAGGSAQLSAIPRDAAGNPLTGRTVVWTSSSDPIAVVSSTGRVTAVAAGTAVITATSETISGTSSVTVSNVPVASVTITPANPTLGVSQTLGMTATMRDAAGNILSGRAVTWASQNQAVATVDVQGVVTAVASGTATLTATSEGINGTTLITVSAVPVARVDVAPTTVSLNPGQTSQLTATAYDANNNVLVRPVTWASNNPGVATVSATGLVTAVATGNATISATSGGVTGTSLVTVALVPVATVTVTPGAPNMFPNDVLQLTATARDAGGNLITGRPTTWVSSNTNVATVTNTGLVTAVSQTPAAATITATVDGVSGSATITINQTPVASVTLTPASASILQGQQTSFIAVARDAGGNVLSRPITWSTTSATVIINVTQAGVVTGINPGTEGVIATAIGGGAGGANIGDTSSVTVSLVPVASMAISPKPVSLFTSQQQTLTLQLFDSI
ncbi:MAG TPA: Ig-like domain-containing protein, partial [Gemmatimonadaceae bacterium]|nr:Ig-like domain-containing protein [Gemmatimonadaceae bacterium]